MQEGSFGGDSLFYVIIDILSDVDDFVVELIPSLMNIGIPKEIKIKENRVACTPAGVRHLVSAGHHVVVERGAGKGSGFSDEKYKRSGAIIACSAEEVWKNELIVKVKEPLAE